MTLTHLGHLVESKSSNHHFMQTLLRDNEWTCMIHQSLLSTSCRKTSFRAFIVSRWFQTIHAFFSRGTSLIFEFSRRRREVARAVCSAEQESALSTLRTRRKARRVTEANHLALPQVWNIEELAPPVSTGSRISFSTTFLHNLIHF